MYTGESETGERELCETPKTANWIRLPVLSEPTECRPKTWSWKEELNYCLSGRINRRKKCQARFDTRVLYVSCRTFTALFYDSGGRWELSMVILFQLAKMHHNLVLLQIYEVNWTIQSSLKCRDVKNWNRRVKRTFVFSPLKSLKTSDYGRRCW